MFPSVTPGADANVLEDITVTAHKGETVAFIGATGSGKTTLVNLIPRLYDVSEGSVKVDGVGCTDYDMKKLRDKLGYVSQKAVLFAGTIRDNIRLGDNGKAAVPDNEIEKALDIAQSSDFVGNIPEGIGGAVSRMAPTSPVVRNSGCRLHVRSHANRKSIFLTIRFLRWTTKPTASSAAV